jgi:hypothetical protein
MKLRKFIFKIASWTFKGAAVIAVPALMPASVGIGERLGWAGAVLVWLYMGRLTGNNNRTQDQA